MKYYIIFLKNGTVVDVTTHDEAESRDMYFDEAELIAKQNGSYYDQVQKINICN